MIKMGKLALYAGASVVGVVANTLIRNAMWDSKAANTAVVALGISRKKAMECVKQFRKRAKKEMRKTGSDYFCMDINEFLNLSTSA
jgi:hypothetical protein